MYTNSLLKFFALTSTLLFFGLIINSTAHAHRGRADEPDDCRIRVSYEWIHFTAYTPTLSGKRDYCDIIPELGPTNLVFDYEGKKLRQFTLEFEVTKEPAGNRVFYQPPQTAQSGTVTGSVDFSQFGAGDYLVHITIVHKDKKLDSHLPLQIGMGAPSDGGWLKFIGLFGSVLLILYLVIRWANSKTTKTSPQPDEE